MPNDGLRPSLSRPLWLVPLLALAVGLPARAAAPRDEALRLVPPDAGFCLVIQDLRGHADAFLNSPFVEGFLKSSLGVAAGGAPETQKLTEAEAFLQKVLGVSAARLRDDILGDAVVLTYWPGPPGHPEREEGLLLIRARDAALLADVIDRLNQAQKAGGDLKDVEVRKYRDVAYTCRVEGKGTNFYYLRGPVLAFSSQEQVLHRVIDRDRQADAEAEPAVARELRLLGADRDLAALWLNPRAFDADLEQHAARADGPEAGVRKGVLTYWKALDGLAVSLALHRDDVELRLAVRAHEKRLPAPARPLFTREGRRSELWRLFPENALLTVAGRIDLSCLDEALGPFLAADAQKALREKVDRATGLLGKDVLRDVLPALGPDWGCCVSAPPPGKAWFPHVLWALRVRPGDQEPPVDRVLLKALSTVATVAVFAYNSNHADPITVKIVMQGPTEVSCISNPKLFPPGLEPAFASKDGYLLLASSPAAIAAFRGSPSPGAPPGGEAEVPLVRLSLRELRRFVGERLDVVTAYVAEKNGLPREAVTHHLSGLLQATELLDRLELSQRSGPGRFTLTLRLRTELPLRK
jgi:hypothetical protein